MFGLLGPFEKANAPPCRLPHTVGPSAATSLCAVSSGWCPVVLTLGLCGIGVRRPRTSRSHPTARPGIAQLTRQRLAELCQEKSKADLLWKTFWSSLKAGMSPLSSAGLTEQQRELLRSLDEVFAEAVKPEAVELFDQPMSEDSEVKLNNTTDTTAVENPDLKNLTHKFLLRLHDGLSVESVLIPPKVAQHKVFAQATTVCISSQVGCAQGCRFCRTGHMGLLRNLAPEEMIAQVVQGRRIAQKLCLAPVLKVVFMGMGEPLANLENVKLAIETLSDLHRMAFARKRIQISTVGPSPSQILALKGLRCGLVWSLHSANDLLRQQLVPTTRHSMTELRDAFAELLKSKGQPDRFMVAVVMIAGINDTEEHAIQLAEFLRPLYEDPHIFLSVNLIPYNENPQDCFTSSKAETIERFRERINEAIPSLSIHVRQTRGSEASAACGQLATQHKKMFEQFLPHSDCAIFASCVQSI